MVQFKPTVSLQGAAHPCKPLFFTLSIGRITPCYLRALGKEVSSCNSFQKYLSHVLMTTYSPVCFMSSLPTFYQQGSVFNSSYSTYSSKKNQITGGAHCVTQELSRYEMRIMELLRMGGGQSSMHRKTETVTPFYRSVLFRKQQSIIKMSSRS